MKAGGLYKAVFLLWNFSGYLGRLYNSSRAPKNDLFYFCLLFMMVYSEVQANKTSYIFTCSSVFIFFGYAKQVFNATASCVCIHPPFIHFTIHSGQNIICFIEYKMESFSINNFQHSIYVFIFKAII